MKNECRCHTPTTFLLLFLNCCVKAPQKFLFLRSVFSSMKLNKIHHCHSCQIFISFSTLLLWESTTKWLWCLSCHKLQKNTNKKQWVSCVFTLSVRLSCLQAEAHRNAAVVKMLRTHTRGPPSRGPVRPLVSLGVGLLHLLLLLSTCLGQDTDGNGAPPSWLSHFFPHTDDPEPAAVRPAGISISDRGNSTFLTGFAAPRSPELLMQLSHNTSFLIHYLCTTSLAGCFEWDLHRAQCCPLQGLTHYRRSKIFPTLYSVFLLERWRSW